MIKRIFVILAAIIGVAVIIVAIITIISVAAQNVPPSTKAPTLDREIDATAQCKDGDYSYSTSHAGTCSAHGGVKQWL